MPSWKKVIISGSSAELSSLYAPSITGSLQGTASYAIYAETASISNATTLTQLLVINQTGFTINKGVVVRISGSNNASDIPRITTASYETDGVSANTLGIASANITNGSQGYVITEGVLTGINTTGWSSGTLLFLGATGSITASTPQAPLHAVRLGQVIREQNNNGSIHVRVDNGYEIGELHDITDNTTTSSHGDLLVKSGSVWINSVQLTGSYGLTGSLNMPSAVNANNASKIHVSQYPNPSGSLTSGVGSVLYNFGRSAEGLILQYRDYNYGDVGGLKITDAGVAIYGSGDTDVFKVIEEDTNIQRFSINNSGYVGINKTGTAAQETTTNAYLDVNGDAIITGSLIVTNNITGSGLRISGSTSTDLVRITQTGTGNALVVEDSTNPDSTPFRIDGSGQTSIGTTTSYGPLTVRGNGATGITIDVDGNASNEWQSSRLFFKITGSASGLDTSIRNLSGSFLFSTLATANGSSGTVAMTISASGDVGIGTSGPGASLHLYRTGDPNLMIIERNATANAPIRYKNTIGSMYAGLSTSASFAVGTSNDLMNASTTILTVSASGDVGIGTITPTAKLHVIGNTIVTGSMTIGSSSIGPNENTITLGARDAGSEGGQLGLNAPGGTYTSASFIDNYTNLFRILRGTNAGSDAVVAQWNMHNKQMQLPAYTSPTSFTATSLVGILGFDSSGNIITTTTSSGGGGGGVTITNNTDNYIVTATGTANTLNGESGLQYNGSSLAVTGQITSSGAIISNTNGAMYFRGGDDAELWDINVANTVGIYGQQDSQRGAVKLGSSGPTLHGSGSRLGIATITPNATLDVNGTAIITGSARITGSLSVTGSTIITGSTSTDLVRITQTGAGNALIVEDSTNPDSNAFVIDSSGSVGIGVPTITGPSAYNTRLLVSTENLGQSAIRAYGFANHAIIGLGVSSYAGVYGWNANDSGSLVGVWGRAEFADTAYGGSEWIGGKFEAAGDPGVGTNYSVQLTDGTEGAGKVLVSQTATGKANWSTQLSGSYGLTGSLSFPSSSLISFSSNNVNYAGRMIVSNLPNPTGTSTISSALYNYGAANEGLYVQFGYSGDQGGIKITDDGVAVFGGGDEDLFKVIDEDSDTQVFAINNQGRVGINKSTSPGFATPLNATLDVNGTATVSGSLTATSAVTFNGLSNSTTSNVVYIDTVTGALSYGTATSGSSSSGSAFPYTGSARITGSLSVTGSIYGTEIISTSNQYGDTTNITPALVSAESNDGANAIIQKVAYTNTTGIDYTPVVTKYYPRDISYTARGTNSLSYNQLIAGNVLNAQEHWGYDGIQYGIGYHSYTMAFGTWDNASHPTIWRLQLTPSGSTTLVQRMEIDDVGNLTIDSPTVINGSLTVTGSYNSPSGNTIDSDAFIQAGLLYLSNNF